MIGFILRLRQSAFAVLVTLTILLCTLWQGALYPFGLASKPSGRRMTSSFVGEAAFNGRRWGRIMAAVIDRAFLMLGDKPQHCHRAFINYGTQDD
jgi:hypothetical protein